MLAIPDVVSSPEAVRVGEKNGIGRLLISNVKHLPDGTLLHVEEIRTGRKQLALQSMRMYPGTRDATNLFGDPKLYGQTITGDAPIVVHFPSDSKPLPEPDYDSLAKSAEYTARYRASHESTPAQLAAGNYPKRKLPWHGMVISIENEAGSVRCGVDPNG